MFEGPKLKIERANHHIQELETVLDCFWKKGDLCALSVEEDVREGMALLKFKLLKKLPSAVPLIVGDAVHNLRTALDLMASDIVHMAGGTPNKHTKFVFRETRDELVAALNGGKLQTAPAGIISLIIDTIKPYKGGNDALAGLHDLDIQDKHLLITPVIHELRMRSIEAMTGDGSIIEASLTVSDGREISAIGDTAPIKIARYGQSSFNVSFDKGQPFENEPILPTLHYLSQTVAGVVQTIENGYI